ncbi:hypothetical protein VNI00_006991 [Paramarasmius palmivorus]|uniref:Uncharacterized protein n=1 Tax=Paramarasmius palmivorus TaxID=297713 RepID=A0AAW0D450_9AGAR
MSEGRKPVTFTSLFRRATPKAVMVAKEMQWNGRISLTDMEYSAAGSTYTRVRGYSTGVNTQLTPPTSPITSTRRPMHTRSLSQPAFKIPLNTKLPPLPPLPSKTQFGLKRKASMGFRKSGKPGGCSMSDRRGSSAGEEQDVLRSVGKRPNTSDGSHGSPAWKIRGTFSFGRRPEVPIQEGKGAQVKAAGSTFIMVCTATDPSTYPRTTSKMIFRVGEQMKSDRHHAQSNASKTWSSKRQQTGNRKAQVLEQGDDQGSRDRSASVPAVKVSRPPVARSSSAKSTSTTHTNHFDNMPMLPSPLPSPIPSMYSTPLPSPPPSPLFGLSQHPAPKPVLRASSPRPRPSPLLLSNTGTTECPYLQTPTPLSPIFPPLSPATSMKSSKSSKSLSRSPSLPTLFRGSRKASRQPSLGPVDVYA